MGGCFKGVNQMKKHMIVLGIITVILVGGFSGCVGPQTTDYFNGSYAAYEQTILTVTNINGKVEITGWNETNVSVNAVKRSSFGKEELDKIEINVTSFGKYLDIVTKYTGLTTIQGGVDITIKVPRTINIQSVRTSNGEIQISDVKGDLKTLSSNGAIVIENVDGYVSAETSNGRVEVKGTTGIKRIRTSNGAIIAEIADLNDNASINTSNAAVTVYLNPALNATIEMITSNGKVTVEGVSLNVELLEETHVVGSLGSGGRRLDIHTSNANIQLIKLVT
jgi:hypothetical protein